MGAGIAEGNAIPVSRPRTHGDPAHLSERACPARPAGNRLTGQSGAGGAVARQEDPGRGAAELRSEPAGAVRLLPGDGSARGVDEVVHRLLEHRLELRELVRRVLLERCEVDL